MSVRIGCTLWMGAIYNKFKNYVFQNGQPDAQLSDDSESAVVIFSCEAAFQWYNGKVVWLSVIISFTIVIQFSLTTSQFTLRLLFAFSFKIFYLSVYTLVLWHSFLKLLFEILNRKSLKEVWMLISVFVVSGILDSWGSQVHSLDFQLLRWKISWTP